MNKINFFVPIYSSDNNERQLELDLCYKNNLLNDFITVIPIIAQDRLTYNDCFLKINETSGDDDINIISNSDVYLNETIENAVSIKNKELYALSRWNLLKNGEISFDGRDHSQDCWIFRGKINDVDVPYLMGVNGCDNKIALCFHNSGYKVLNPSKSIITIHVHNSNFRTYDFSFFYPKPYLAIKPHYLGEEPILRLY